MQREPEQLQEIYDAVFHILLCLKPVEFIIAWTTQKFLQIATVYCMHMQNWS